MRNNSQSKTKNLAKAFKRRKELASFTGFQKDTEKGALVDSVGITNYMQYPKQSNALEA